MPGLIYTKAEVVILKSHPDFDEKWLRDRLAEEPAMLGLGDLVLRDVERTQTRAGRLDLLFSDAQDRCRFEVELMLGPMDESHVIRAIEYWDIERRQSPQYDHCAVLVAEQVGARFMNVLSLFTPVIPIIALQMTALRVNEYLTLQFYRVLEGRPNEPAARAERRARGTLTPSASAALPPNMAPVMLEECLAILREISPGIAFDQRREVVALVQGERRTESICFYPHREFIGVKARVQHKEDWLARLQAVGIVVLSGGPLRKRTHFRLIPEQIRGQRVLLKELFTATLREQGFLQP